MKKLALTLSILSVVAAFSQEIVQPIAGNPSLYTEKVTQTRAGNNLDSTFIYSDSPLNITDVWDDFSVNKFVQYPPAFTDPNVTSTWYWCLMDNSNTFPEPDTVQFCDSTFAHHDSVFVVNNLPTTFTSNFTPHSIWMNDLNTYPISGVVMDLYDECYVLVDSVFDGVPDPDQDTIWYNNPPQFVQDSIHLFFANLNDNSQIWRTNSACHNYTMAIDPWSLGVATFDGVDSTGYPYNFGSNSNGPADELISKPVNLNGTSNVFLDFLYQAQGHGNMPEAGDSLVVDFWLVDSSKWYNFWHTVPPYTANQWDTAHIAVPSNFLDNGFRFRFRNYASLAGALDHWHIDYVSLNENPLLFIQPYKDLAVSYPVPTLLKDYTAVPWDHYLNLPSPNDQMDDTTFLAVYNSDVDATNVDGPGMELEISYNGSVQGTYVLGNPSGPAPWDGNWLLGMNHYPILTATHHPYFDAPGNDSLALFDYKINASAGVAASNVYNVNDTTYGQQQFKNYYAYDDGSAEVAYGIQGSNAQLAYEFNAYEADTLTGVLFHFVPSVNDVSNNVMLLTVWDDDNGEPGDILYQDDYFLPHYPEYGGSKNEFRYYKFVNPSFPSTIAVGQKFYVGWEQVDSESLNIGMDRNIVNNTKIHFNTGGTWITSSQPGSLMIRPVFSTAINHTLSAKEERLQPEVSMYPNPARAQVFFTGLSGDYTLTVYDMSGRAVLVQSNADVLDIEELNTGVYIVDIRDQSGVSLYSDKLIKE